LKARTHAQRLLVRIEYKERAKTYVGLHYPDDDTKHFPIKSGQAEGGRGMALNIFIPCHNSVHK